MERLLDAVNVTDMSPDTLVERVKSASESAALRIFPEDSASDRDDRIRATFTAFMARAAQRGIESSVGTAFTTSQLSMTEQLDVVRRAMAHFQKFKSMTGSEKKAAVVQLLRNIFIKFKPDATELELNDVSMLASSAIELAVEARQGRVCGEAVGAFVADAAMTSCMNGWCVPKKSLN